MSAKSFVAFGVLSCIALLLFYWYKHDRERIEKKYMTPEVHCAS